MRARPGTSPAHCLPDVRGGTAAALDSCTDWPPDTAHKAACACRRAQWLAVLFGPPGCFLRWYLSRFNYKLPGHWKWLPCGTFAANMIACLVDYIVGVRSPCMQNLRCMPVEDV